MGNRMYNYVLVYLTLSANINLKMPHLHLRLLMDGHGPLSTWLKR